MKKLIIALLISAVALASLACGSDPELTGTTSETTSAPEASAGASEPKATGDNEPKASDSGAETSEPTRAFARLTPEPTPTFRPTRDFSADPLSRDEERQCAVLERDWDPQGYALSDFSRQLRDTDTGQGYYTTLNAYIEACRNREYSLPPTFQEAVREQRKWIKGLNDTDRQDYRAICKAAKESLQTDFGELARRINRTRPIRSAEREEIHAAHVAETTETLLEKYPDASSWIHDAEPDMEIICLDLWR
ncbi:MAG: hypothetical protein OXF79_10740 [Chloroflexi bacterium]|nr:hypothetical protein [Chloroflexota bacterium]